MNEQIREFRLEYDFLSNYYPARVRVEGLDYYNSEAAYQAAKCQDRADRLAFTSLMSNDAKKLGRQVTVRPDWEQVKLAEMEKVVRAKFTQNPHLARYLLDTGDAALTEGNTWNDLFWGADLKTGRGENNLGKLLMALREEYRRTGIPQPEEALPPAPRFLAADGLQAVMEDITLTGCRCIVNAATDELSPSGAEAAVFRAGGPRLREEYEALGPIPVTRARLTGGGRSEARWVIHTVGPRYGGDDSRDGQLADTYRNVLNLARETGVGSVALPVMSVGKFSYPKERAAAIAVSAVREWRACNREAALDITFACVDKAVYQGLCKALGEL